MQLESGPDSVRDSWRRRLHSGVNIEQGATVEVSRIVASARTNERFYACKQRNFFGLLQNRLRPKRNSDVDIKQYTRPINTFMKGLFMSPVIHDWIGNVQDSQGVSASEMTYIVSGGALNSTHSLMR